MDDYTGNYDVYNNRAAGADGLRTGGDPYGAEGYGEGYGESYDAYGSAYRGDRGEYRGARANPNGARFWRARCSLLLAVTCSFKG